MIGIPEALEVLRPNSQWVLIEDDYENIEWLDDSPKPSKKEIDDKISELQELQAQNKYKELRANEYPSIADQLDLLYHHGYDGWKEVINTVKEKYPKDSAYVDPNPEK